MKNQPLPERDWEKEIKDFGNKIAMQLRPSNDTMEAVRLVRKELPDFIKSVESSAYQRGREEERNMLMANLKDFRYENGTHVIGIERLITFLSPSNNQ
jgi:hypothetical protein